MSVFFERCCHGNCLESCKVVMIHGEFTQQEGRKKRMEKCLCVTNMTGLLLSSEDQVLIFT